MDRRGQSSSSSRGLDRPMWRNNSRLEASSDDERQFSRKSSTTSSSRPNSSHLAAPGNNLNARTTLPSSSPFHDRNSLFRSDGSRVTKSFSTPSTPYQQASRVPPIQQSRSNPIAPVWNAGPSQPQRTINAQRTPHRNSGYASAPSTIPRGPAGRKAGSGAPMWNPANEPRSLNLTRITPSRQRPQIEITKSVNYPTPFWQHQDAEHEAQQRVERRKAKLGELGDYTGPHKAPPTQKPQRAYLNPAFQVVENLGLDEGQEKDGDAPMEVDGPAPSLPSPPPPPRPRPKGIKTSRIRNDITRRRLDPTTYMAARKTKWLPEDSPEASDSDTSLSSSDSDKSTPDSVIELTDSESEEGGKEKAEQGQISDSEVIIIEAPQPRITIPLPQVLPATSQTPILPGPPETLVTALDELCGAPIRMQATKQLPFLLRNLRRGFRLRCNAIGIKTTRARPRMPIVVRYEYTEKIYEARMSKWFCPLCELHGALPNKDMLRCHLQWDHPEVILERWEQRANNQGKSEWRIHFLVPEIIYDIVRPRKYEYIPKIEFQEPSIEPESATPPPGPAEPGRLTSVPPSTTVPSHSPSRLHSRETTPSVGASESVTQKLEQAELVKIKTAYPEGRETTTPGGYRTSTAPSLSSHSRLTNTDITQESEPLSTVRIEHTPGPPGGVYPSPPPVHDPLGPAAQAPFLPAKSEYEGPDIHYSCRPGGPSVFDLLGTLPMEPFGVLEWDILEREEEIYESDEIKVEYKVMHALWLRWIVLNRTEFMRNYYKGVIAFIDAYWRMIHQAAGWKAIRYWLLLLLAHRFLTGREVAKALKHYEDLTGMSHW